MTDPRLPPIETALSGSPRTGTLILPQPRPTLRVEVRRTGPDTAVLTVERHAPEIALRLVRGTLDEPDYWLGQGWIDVYEWTIRADPVMRALILHDDLVQRVPVTAERIAAWEAAWVPVP